MLLNSNIRAIPIDRRERGIHIAMEGNALNFKKIYFAFILCLNLFNLCVSVPPWFNLSLTTQTSKTNQTKKFPLCLGGMFK